MTTKIKNRKPVDLRTVKKHKLYPVLNGYIKEIFDGQPELEHFIIESAELLEEDLFARYQVHYKIDELVQVLDAYGEWLPLGGYQIDRADFFLPETEGQS